MDEKDVKSGESSNPQANSGNVVSAVDDKGVPWMNRAKEMERKYGELESRSKELEAKLNGVIGKLAETGVNVLDHSDEARKRERLTTFASDPDAFTDSKIEEAMFRLEGREAADWLQAQEGWKPEYGTEIGRIIQEEGLFSRPLKRAKTAWSLLKDSHPDFVRAREEARAKELSRYQVSGPGRSAPVPESQEEQDLLKALKSTGNIMEQSKLIAKLSSARYKRETGQVLRRPGERT